MRDYDFFLNRDLVISKKKHSNIVGIDNLIEMISDHIIIEFAFPNIIYPFIRFHHLSCLDR